MKDGLPCGESGVLAAQFSHKQAVRLPIITNGSQNASLNKPQCLAVNSSDGDIDVDSAAACTSNGGEGDSWDRWTAIKESGPGVSPIVWEFKNQFFTKTSECMYDDTQPSPIYAACNNSDVFEWWTWPGSNL
jgi:hypothetical protein